MSTNYICDFCGEEIENQNEYRRTYSPVYKTKRLNINLSITSDNKSFEHICSKCGFEITVWLLCPKKEKPVQPKSEPKE